jgi:signal transduction histidine kinase
MASHQLRTPLTAIKGYISMMLEGIYNNFSPKAKEKLKYVLYSNERLIRIVNDLLNISKIELGKMEINKEKFQIEDLIDNVYQEMRPEAQKKNLKFIWQKPEIPLPKINIDQLKIRQVISNLIDNAIRYTQKGEIEIKAEKKNLYIQISVKDTGEGLTKEEKEKIFTGFLRGSAGTTYWIEGAGLGLYVAKKFVEMHNGKIWAESKGKGEGSTFYVELPL